MRGPVRSRLFNAWVATMMLAWPPMTYSQEIPKAPAFTVYGMPDGLSQGTVEAMMQDSIGFLWIGTHDGLNQFDGTRFRAFKHSRDDSTSLSDDYVRSLLAAPGGRIWVGTERGGLNLFDPNTRAATRYPLDDLGPWQRDAGPDNARENTGRTVEHLARTHWGHLILGTDVGLVSFDPASGRAEGIEVPADGEAAGLCSMGDGIVVGFSSGEVWLLNEGHQWSRIESLDSGVSFVTCETGTLVKVGTLGGMLHELDPLRPTRRDTVDLSRFAGEAFRLTDAVRLADGGLWVASLEGAFAASVNGGQMARVPAGVQGRSIPDPWVTDLLVDRSGVLWLGTWNGLASLHPLARSMTRVFTRVDAGPGLAGAGVVAIEPDEEGTWLGTLGGGLQRLTESPESGTVEIHRPPQLDPWGEAWVFDLEGDGAGGLWIAAHARGVLHFTADGSVIDVPIVDVRGERRVATVLSVHRDRAGIVWAGTVEMGLLRFSPDEGRFAPVAGEGWDLGSLYVWPIAKGSDGHLWVGAYNGGVSRVDPEIGRMVRYSVGPAGLSDARILTLFVDSEGIVWVGTEGGGLNRIDPRTDDVTVYTVEDGLPHDHVEGIVEDPLGYLWIATNDGLGRFDRATGSFRVFRAASGLAGNRFLANAAQVGGEGRLYFGGEDGLTIIDPTKMRIDSSPPPVALTGFRIRGGEASLSRALAEDGLDLGPTENFFSFDFAALDYADPSQNRYRYRLEPLDDGWVDAGTDQTASYTSVPPDDYVFRVAARNSDGVWNEGALTIPVRVGAPFYMTWWFRIGALILAAGVVVAFYRYRVAELQRLQDLRLGIAGRLHDDISANLSSIAMKADLVARGHDLDPEKRVLVDEVRRAARESAHRVRDTVWVVSTRYDDLPHLVEKMRDTADSLLLGHLEYDFSISPEPPPRDRMSWEVRQDVYLLFKESLNNIIKHAEARKADIHIRAFDRTLHVEVRDDGAGFDADHVPEGNGLGLMRSRMARHKGRLDLVSTPGEGTTVSFEVALK